LRSGGVIILPTETVYGLAANALDSEAIGRVFTIKGRPSDNPLIVHIGEVDSVNQLVNRWPEQAEALADAFWPGPLTLVLSKKAHVPGVVTGGLNTVAVRMPDHPVALEILRAAGVPVAAPSANRFKMLSPTRAEDIDIQIASQVDLIVDGGPANYGIESTVLDLTGETPALLRPGAITQQQIESLLGAPILVGDGTERRSPGLYPRHYSPRAILRLVERAGQGPALVLRDDMLPGQIRMPSNAKEYASQLYAALNHLDNFGADLIEVESPPRDPDWDAVWDRLTRAATTE
jgi:L-threonylcarbamoyladenylate synthase